MNLNSMETKKNNSYLKAFENLQDTRMSQEAKWLNDLRSKAFSRFANLGFPSLKEEAWKYTNVSPIAQTDFNLPQANAEEDAVISNDFISGKIKGYPLIFRNGRFAPDLSHVPQGVRLSSISEESRLSSEMLKRYLSKIVTFDSNAFAALNTAFFQSGLFVRIEQNRVLDKPIVLIHQSGSLRDALMIQPRIFVLSEAFSKASIVEIFSASNAQTKYFHNIVHEYLIQAHAALHWIKIQTEAEESFHIDTAQVLQSQGSFFQSVVVDLGGKLVRNNL